MASLRDQGIDPAYHASAQWFGDAPSSEDFLIHLSKRIVTLMNERDRTHPFWDILSPEIRHELHDTIATGPVDFLYGYQAVAEKNPNFRADVFNASATVDDKHGRGAVILNVHLSGYSCQAQKAGVILSNWRRSQEKWRCFDHPIAVETSVGVLRPDLIAASQLSGPQRFHTDVAATSPDEIGTMGSLTTTTYAEQIEMRNLCDADL